MEVFESDTNDIQQGDRTDLTPHLYCPMVAKVFERIINRKILNYLLYLLSKDYDSVVKQVFLMSLDLYSSGKSSFYSNLVRMSEFYNVPNFDPLLVTDAKINHYLKLMQQQYILHWQHTLEHSNKLEFYNTFKTEYTPSYFLDLTKKNHL